MLATYLAPVLVSGAAGSRDPVTVNPFRVTLAGAVLPIALQALAAVTVVRCPSVAPTVAGLAALNVARPSNVASFFYGDELLL